MSESRTVLAGIHRLQSEYDNALSCIRCGQCLSVCPTYQLTFAEEESPRGRIALARALVEGALPVTPDLIEHSQNCLLCEACTAICPAGVRMEPLGVAVREVIKEQARGGRLRRRMRRAVMDYAFGSMARFRAVCRLAWLYQRSGARRLVRASGLLSLLRLSGMDAMLPEMPGRFLVPKGQVWPAAPPFPPNAGGERESQEDWSASSAVGTVVGMEGMRRTAPRVALFTGCIMSTAFAGTTEATARLLARRGCEVVAVPGQGCCGALHLHGGEPEGAARLARANLAAVNPADFDLIVVNSAGCGSMLKGYAHLFHDDPDMKERAAAFSACVRDVTEALDALPRPKRGVEAEEAGDAADRPLVVTLQEPCHLAHAQRIQQQPRRLLRAVPGLELREMAESALCCGSAGIYNLTHPETAAKLLNRKLDNALATGARLIVTANPGCLLQLRAGVRARGLGLSVEHIADVLDRYEV